MAILSVQQNMLAKFNEVLQQRAIPEKSKSPGWDQAIEKLAAEIETRHYSRKTLKAYADWARKFQRYLCDKPPDKLSSPDVKEYLK
jgi:hypothetical protein